VRAEIASQHYLAAALQSQKPLHAGLKHSFALLDKFIVEDRMTVPFKGILAVLSIAMATTSPALAADGTTFGDKPTYQSGAQAEYAPSGDKKAFTITLGDLEVAIDTGKLPEKSAKRARSPATDTPVATRVFSTVIPVKGGKSIKTSFFVSGYVVTTEGSQGTLLFSVNGQNTLTKFGAKLDQSFVKRLDFKAKSASEIRMTVFLLAERDARYPNAAAYLNVSNIDTDAALAKQKVAGKATK
jgi:hypothetical protein